jgi:hypothetical protein
MLTACLKKHSKKLVYILSVDLNQELNVILAKKSKPTSIKSDLTFVGF